MFEELEGFEPGDGSGRWSITLLVGEVRKGVTGAIVDFNIDSFSSSVHTPFERSNFVGRNPAIERAENPHYTGVDFLNVPGIGWQRAVIHNTRGKLRFMNRELNRQASTHGPPKRANVLCVYIKAAGEIVECCFQIAYRPILPKTALELASFRRIGRDFAFVKNHRKRDVPIRRELFSLFLHPFVQTPPFMNDDYRSMTPRITRQGEKSCNVLFGVPECHHPYFRPSRPTRRGR